MLRGDEASFHAVIDGMFEGLYGALSSEERARIAEFASPEQEVVLGVWEMILATDVAMLDELVDNTAAASPCRTSRCTARIPARSTASGSRR